MKKQILATAVALGMFSTAFAVTAQSGFYLSGDFGFSFPKSHSNSGTDQIYDGGYNTTLSTTQKNRHVGTGIAIGYEYAINKNILVGAELGYTYFGNTVYSTMGDRKSNVPPIIFFTLQDKVTGMSTMATLTYLDQTGFNIFGKAGLINTYRDLSLNVHDTASPTTHKYDLNYDILSSHKWLPTIVIGVGYMPIQNLNITLQYQYVYGDNKKNFDMQDDENGNMREMGKKPLSQNLISFGLTYKFNL